MIKKHESIELKWNRDRWCSDQKVQYCYDYINTIDLTFKIFVAHKRKKKTDLDQLKS